MLTVLIWLDWRGQCNFKLNPIGRELKYSFFLNKESKDRLDIEKKIIGNNNTCQLNSR